MDFKNTRIQPLVGRKLPLSNPQLPRPLWKQFKKDFPNSLIFTPFFSDVRHLMLLEGPASHLAAVIPVHFKAILQAFSIDEAVVDGGVDQDLSYLHLAVLTGDLPLAYEAVRLGTSVHCKNKRGESPLLYGCDLLSLFLRHGKPRTIDSVPAQVAAACVPYAARMAGVCLFLIAQHSDPNETREINISVLALACIIGSWDLIHALLLHGAIPTQGLEKVFSNETDKMRFRSLVSQLSNLPRPPRICPCGSERPLKECHAHSQPWSAEYLCPCKSRKINSACCAKKTDFSWSEIWDEEKGWLDITCTITRHVRATNPDGPEPDESHLRCAMFVAGVAGVQEAFVPPTGQNSRWIDMPNLLIMQELANKRKIDPAFVAASKKTMIVPSPATVRSGMPKTEWTEARGAWNAAVDAYIASGIDTRAPELIEAAAKIGPAGGPLHRKCEAVGCGNTENNHSDSTKSFQHCSGCKTAIYCSHICQKRTWKAHKSACRAGDAQAQMLPSQEVYAAKLASTTGFRFA
ncbi:hypothetical protein B0H11DRAFT_118731 [Mycena galericulata]|nr:hypothetical protein B0H11DRAFT_118731 [Mycena galericulata]